MEFVIGARREVKAARKESIKSLKSEERQLLQRATAFSFEALQLLRTRS